MADPMGGRWQRPLERMQPRMNRLRQELRRVPAFAHCSRSELSSVIRWGDLIEVETGQTVTRQDQGGYWFFVVLAGEVRLVRAGRSAGSLRPGQHFGQESLVGLRPQPFTAVAGPGTVVFALGPRFALSLMSVSPAFQRALLPDVAPEDYVSHFRRMLDLGRGEWHEVAARTWGEAHFPASEGPQRETVRPWGPGVKVRGGPPSPGRPAGRVLSLAEAARVVARLPAVAEDPPPTAHLERPLVSRRVRLMVAALGMAFFGMLMTLYHPPRVVITAGRPIDVLADIRITGARIHHPSGTYLLLWVRQSQPALGGLLWDVALGRTTLGVDPQLSSAAAESEVLRAGRGQYLQSQATAITAAMRAAGADPRRVYVHIRDRGLIGPSAGLVYALAVYDVLSGADLADGRVVAATGALEPDGRVETVGWLAMKVQGALSQSAQVLIVPAGQEWSAETPIPTVYPVRNLTEAMADLAEGRHLSNAGARR